MREPYGTLWNYLVVQQNWQPGKWNYNVKWTGSAFYIGTDNDHVTILENTPGFHHSFNEDGQHVTRDQHESATTLQKIIEHIKYNPSAYPEPSILKALEYLNANAR